MSSGEAPPPASSGAAFMFADGDEVAPDDRSEVAARRWSDALLAARLLAIDPVAVGGIVVRARVGPVLDAWLSYLYARLGDRPVKRVPSHATEDRLIGGLDLAATLHSGQLVAERGLLADANGGVVVVPMAERVSATTAACLNAALDQGRMTLERDGLTERFDTRIGVVLLDEGIDDERVPIGLADRLAFHVDLGLQRLSDARAAADDAEFDVLAEDWRNVTAEASVVEALCGAAMALGVDSLRVAIQALKVARMHAALAGRDEVEEPDVAVAARLVLGPRATMLPGTEPEEEAPPPSPPEEPNENPSSDEDDASSFEGPLEDVILEAVQASMPAGLLAQLSAAGRARQPAGAMGSAGMLVTGKQRGRPSGVRPGHPRRGGRLNVVATLRAAAPWQKIRARRNRRVERRVEVRQDDFRITRFKRRTETLTIFAVDASGSAALQRLAEAKGAVELVLNDCYVRRDHVALLAFRGTEAELILPPTRSLVRAKRCLAAMAGGGTTPLATGLDAARALAEDVRRRGQSPIVVVMTDGRANIARDGQPDRKRASSDAVSAAALLKERDIATLFVDTAPRPRSDARELATAMGAHYLHLPYADKQGISAWVQGASAGAIA